MFNKSCRLNKIKFLVFLLIIFIRTNSACALPLQQVCEEVTAVARSVMVVLNSLGKTENTKLNFVTNIVRCLNSIPGNHISLNNDDYLISCEERTAQVSFWINLVSDVIKPEKFIYGRVCSKEKRTNARRAILTLLALAESVPVIWSAFSDFEDVKTPILRDISAFAAVINSLLSTDDKYSKISHTGVLAFMIYSCIKDQIFIEAEKSKLAEEKARLLEEKAKEYDRLRAVELKKKQLYDQWLGTQGR